MYCNKCGKEIDDEALICPHCGCATVNYIRDQARTETRAQLQPTPELKKRTTAMILCIFLGCFGAHRFYVGKIGTGVLWLLTMGFCGIGALIDLICIIGGTFTDEMGNTLYDPHVRIVSNSDTNASANASGATPAAAHQPAVMTQEEYDAATKTPRTVRKIVLIVVAVIILLYIVSSYRPELLDIFRR